MPDAEFHFIELKKFKNKSFAEAFDILEEANWTKEERFAYAQSLDRRRQDENKIAAGVKKGELNKALKIAKKMLTLKKSLEEIAEITELPIDQIKKLLQK